MRKWRLACVAVSLLLAAPVRASLIFDMPDTGNPSANAAFAVAAARWTSILRDSVAVHINVSFAALDAGILGQTSYTEGTVSYSSLVDALSHNPNPSADDQAALAQLQARSSISMLINRTSDNPNGSGSATPYVDNDGNANNNTVWMTSANAKALGLLDSHDPILDASFTFSTAYSWDFNSADGIMPGYYDFTGVVAHEIGHALGFVSGVDVLDYNAAYGAFPSSAYTYVSPLDLFRFSSLSVSQGVGVIDWTADSRDKYFSLDGGQTKIASFATGIRFGDGRQASHWKDNQGIGIMDPTAAPGELLSISLNDARALDAIGWDMAPEPSTYVLCGLGAAILLFRRLLSSVR